MMWSTLSGVPQTNPFQVMWKISGYFSWRAQGLCKDLTYSKKNMSQISKHVRWCVTKAPLRTETSHISCTRFSRVISKSFGIYTMIIAAI